MFNKIKILTIIFILLLAGCSSYDSINGQLEDSRHQDGNPELFFGEIVINDGQNLMKKNFSVTPGTTVFNLMEDLVKRGEMVMEYRGNAPEVFIKNIDGIENDPDENVYWMLYVNDELANLGVAMHVIGDNDVIEWKYVDVSKISF